MAVSLPDPVHAPDMAGVLVLVEGTLLTPHRRTVGSALRAAGKSNDAGFYHAVLNRCRWSALAAARTLLLMPVDRFAASGPVVSTAFGKDSRVLIWDLWNEPDNLGPQGSAELEREVKQELVLRLLPQVFAWGRLVGAAQPLTSGVWQGDWPDDARLTPIQ